MEKMIENRDSKLIDIRVFGVGGGGSNAVVRSIYDPEQKSVEYYIINTDVQALETIEAKKLGNNRICIGKTITRGLGAGASPEQGKKAAEEAKEEIKAAIEGAHMVFVAAGMGGGTGTGASSVVASIAKELGLLTVGVVTKPFNFEGKVKAKKARAGIEELERHCDTLITIQNDKVLEIPEVKEKNLSFQESFLYADKVLKQAIDGIKDLIVQTGEVNMDFADVTQILKDRGTAHVGIGIADTIQEACKNAVCSPMLETSINGAMGCLINYTSGKKENLKLVDVNETASWIEEQADEEAEIIFGTTVDESLGDKIKVTVVATGFSKEQENCEKDEQKQEDSNVSVQEDSNEDLYEIPSFLR